MKLKRLLQCNDFKSIAQLIGLDSIIVSDYDQQIVTLSNTAEPILANTWSPDSLFDEFFSNVEISIGTAFNITALDKEIMDYAHVDGFCMLGNRGINTNCLTYSPIGQYNGSIVTHEETFSIGKYLSIYDTAGKLVYKPSVFFSYRPCEAAYSTLEKIKANDYIKPSKRIIIRDQITSGSEAVGVILSGTNFKTRYYGTVVNIKTLQENFPEEYPTIIQVSASCVSAFKWIINNPKRGLMFPEDLPTKEILNYASKYLGEFTYKKIKYKFNQNLIKL